jgi:UDP-2-acetamido-3-amino-2,3-dideoxy-glucuronate N-acetyltransferase
VTDLGVAVAGAGQWGANHVRTWHALGCLRVVCDPDPGRLAAIRERCPDVETTTDLAAVLRRDDVHGVVLATPAQTHAELAVAALEAGKDVLVEKPMATSLGAARGILRTAEDLGRILMVGHVLEYHPAFLRLREFVAQGVLGRIRYMYSNRLNFGRVRTEENALWSFAPHDLALFLRLAGTAPEEVACRGGSYVSRDVADVTLMSVTFPGGVQAHAFVSWLHPYKEQRFVVVGDRQMAVFDDLADWPAKLTLYPHTVTWQEGRVPVADRAEAVAVELTEEAPLRAECRAFLGAIATRCPPRTDGRSGLAVLELLEAGQASLQRGGAPVRLAPAVSPPGEVSVHATATVDDGAEIGDGTRVWHYSHVMGGARIGRGCVLGQGVFVAATARIGDRVKIQNGVSVYDGVTLEDEVFCGPSVVFTNVVNPRSAIDRTREYRPTVVRRGATLGANSTIVCGADIGSWAFVAAGAVVTRDVPAHALVAGVPARVVGWRCACGEPLAGTDGSLRCGACSRSYRREGQDLVPVAS